MSYVIHGRCKSGSRWFWIAATVDHTETHKCDDPVCINGGPHEYGWEDTEDLALKAMTEAVGRLGGQVRKNCYKGNAPGKASHAAGALKRINAAKRRARPPKTGATGATLLEYLYEPWSWSDYDNPRTRPTKESTRSPSSRKPPSGSILRQHRFLGPQRRCYHPRVHRPAGVRSRHLDPHRFRRHHPKWHDGLRGENRKWDRPVRSTPRNIRMRLWSW